GGGHGRMNQRPRTGYDELTPALAQRIDAACGRLERAWQSRRRPPLEEFLTKVPETAIPVLLRELILVDVLYRRRSRAAGGLPGSLSGPGFRLAGGGAATGHRAGAALARPSSVGGRGASEGSGPARSGRHPVPVGPRLHPAG